MIGATDEEVQRLRAIEAAAIAFLNGTSVTARVRFTPAETRLWDALAHAALDTSLKARAMAQFDAQRSSAIAAYVQGEAHAPAAPPQVHSGLRMHLP